jgi:2-hydroxy-3-keto-5-methylthiopentenyl-1-phosphate phosphatase
MKNKKFTQNVIALVYDFDGTLSPQPMQEYTVLPEIGIDPKDFWEEVGKQTKELEEEPMLAYMRLLIEKAEEKKVHVGREEFKKLGKNVQYFPGVETWFDRVNQFVHDHSKNQIKVNHYIISAGLKEILEGVSIRKYFSRIYASEYHYDHHKVATFPKLLITDTGKTQFLFRINKGKEELGQSINGHMPIEARPIPFENMIYIGDGETDVPSMTVTKIQGGNAVAVYKGGKTRKELKTRDTCKMLLSAGRVNFIAPADYSEGSTLEKRVQLLLQSIISRIGYERELFVCRKENDLTTIS